MTKNVVHCAAGLIITADRRVPGLGLPRPSRPADVIFHLDLPAPWPTGDLKPIYDAPYTDAAGQPTVRVRRAARGFHFDYADGTNVWVAADARDVWCTWAASSTLEDAATYLTGPVLGFVLRLRGAFALHASAVQIGARALVLVGPHGAGKSTTAAALAKRGCPVIADDIVHVKPVKHGREGWLAEPFATILRLWPDGARLALGPESNLPRIAETWDKRALSVGVRDIRAASHAVPVGAVAFLEPRQRLPSAPCVESLTPSEAVVRLAAHSSASHLLDAAARAREFPVVGQLVNDVPCIRAIPSESDVFFTRFIGLLHDWALPFCAVGAELQQ